MWSAALAGLGLGLGLIVAIGAQNAHVLRSGLRREHVGLVVAVCAASDVLLIAAGTAGVGTVVAASRTLTVVVTLAGAAVLLAYGGLAARRAVRGTDALVLDPPPPTPAPDVADVADRNVGPRMAVGNGTGVPVGGGGGATRTGRATGAAVAATTLALTWLNPHVYLDTVVLLGSVAAGHGDARWWFAAGAAVGSVLWFAGLGYGAALLRPVFARPVAWRVLDALIAVVMAGIATGLVVDLVAS